MRIITVAVLLLGLSSVVVAQEENATREFNDAWFAYVSARDSGSKQERLDTSKAVLDIAAESFEANDERMPLLMSNYGVALNDNGDTKGAREVLEEAVDLSEQIHGKDASETVPVLMAYADSLAKIRDSSAQSRAYRDALKIISKNSGDDSVKYADAAFRAGVRILEQSRTTSGKRFLQDAHEIYSQQLGADSEKAGLAAFYLAKTEYAEGDFKDATETSLLALDGLQASPQYLMFARALIVQSYERRGMSEEATEHCLAIGRDSMITPDQDYQPLFRAVPDYPREMLAKGAQGAVDLSFTVDEQGFVRNPEVIKSRGGAAFEKEALAAAKKFRYAPRFEDGQAVATDGVKTRITFRLGGR